GRAGMEGIQSVLIDGFQRAALLPVPLCTSCHGGGVNGYISSAVDKVMTLQVPLIRQRGQRRVDRTRLDARPLLDVPGHHLAANLVAVDGLERAHGAHHQQTSGCNCHTWSLNVIGSSASCSSVLSSSAISRSPAPAPPRAN